MNTHRKQALLAAALLAAVGMVWLVWQRSHQAALPKLLPQQALTPSDGSKGEDRYWQGRLSSQFRDAQDVFALIQMASTYLKRCGGEPNLTPEKQYECRWGVFYPMNMWLRTHRQEILAPLQVRPNLQEGSADEAALYLYATFAGQALNGHPDQALQAYADLEKQRDASTFLRYISMEDVQSLRKASRELKRLATTEMPPDQRLWEMGQAYEAMEQTSWNRVDDGWDSELANGCFEQLLKKHPTSTFADNAWWELHALNGWDNEGEFTKGYLKGIGDAYRKFLRRFPNSEKASLARVNLARQIQACVTFAEENPQRSDALPASERRTWLLEARQLCRAAIPIQETGAESRSGKPSQNKEQALFAEIEASLSRYPATKPGRLMSRPCETPPRTSDNF